MCFHINGQHWFSKAKAIESGKVTEDEWEAAVAEAKAERREWQKRFYANHPDYAAENGVVLDDEGYVVEETQEAKT